MLSATLPLNAEAYHCPSNPECATSANAGMIMRLSLCRYVELDLDAAEETLGLDCKDESHWVTCESLLCIAMVIMKRAAGSQHFWAGGTVSSSGVSLSINRMMYSIHSLLYTIYMYIYKAMCSVFPSAQARCQWATCCS